MAIVRITRTIKDFGILIDESEMTKYIDSKSPYYRSLYYYPSDATDYFKGNKGSIKGYKGKVYTNEIVFDIDSKDLEVSRDNTIRLIQYLEQHGLYNDHAAKISFSGNKGFHVHVNTEHTFSPAELKSLCMYLSKQIKFRYEAGFKIDPSIYNTNRIFRVPNTPHEKSGLFKVEMLSTDLINFSMEEIKKAAVAPQPTYPYESAISKDTIKSIISNVPTKQVISPTKEVILPAIITDKPCIVALQSGDMHEGESNSGLLRLANHYRQLGLTKDQCREKLIEAGINRETKHPGTNQITLDKINGEVLYPIYSGEGYTFTCRDWMLQEKCGGTCQIKCNMPSKQKVFRTTVDALSPELDYIPEGDIVEPSPPEAPVNTVKRASFRNPTDDIPFNDKAKLMGFKSLEDVADEFDVFARDSKRFRVESGIQSWDEKIKILPNGLVIINARAGIGKTSTILNMAKNGAAKGQKALIYQADMAQDEFYTKLASSELKISPDDVIDLFYSEDPKFDDLKVEAKSKIKEAMKDVLISYETDLSVDKIESDVAQLTKEGRKPSVIYIDYLQKLRGGSDYHRSTENLLKLKSIISRYKVCIVGLSQIPRGDGNEETPVHTAAAAQGGAIYEQNASICINLWRPLKFAGVEQDKVMGFAVSKNRMGECFEGMLYFNGAISELRDMSDAERIDAEAAIAAYSELKQQRQGKRGAFR